MIFAPASASCLCRNTKSSPSPSPAWISLPSPEPSSTGGASLMMREDTTFAFWAMPPPQLPVCPPL